MNRYLWINENVYKFAQRGARAFTGCRKLGQVEVNFGSAAQKMKISEILLPKRGYLRKALKPTSRETYSQNYKIYFDTVPSTPSYQSDKNWHQKNSSKRHRSWADSLKE